jgi:hypothetical protein
VFYLQCVIRHPLELSRRILSCGTIGNNFSLFSLSISHAFGRSDNPKAPTFVQSCKLLSIWQLVDSPSVKGVNPVRGQ